MNSAINMLRRLGYRLRRRFLTLRYPNLQIKFGTVIVGKFRFSGNGPAQIGEQCRLVDVSILADGRLTIGNKSFLNGTAIVCKQSVSVGDECLLSDAYITDTDFHNIEPELRRAPLGPKATRPVSIGRNVWIGDRGVILKGSVIGDDSVIGSNSVVRGTIKHRALCIGNPAIVVKDL